MKLYQPVKEVCHVRLFCCVLRALGRHEAGRSLGDLGGIDDSEHSGVAANTGHQLVDASPVSSGTRVGDAGRVTDGSGPNHSEVSRCNLGKILCIDRSSLPLLNLVQSRVLVAV